jgi:hypothetical protein
MTVMQITDEINWIKNDIKNCRTIIEKSKSKKIKAEYRAKLREHYHQLSHLESILITVKCDPLF